MTRGGGAHQWRSAHRYAALVQTTAARAVHEVEVKYRVEDEPALIAALRRHGVVLSAPVRQDDQAYAPTAWRYGAYPLFWTPV